MAHRDKRRLSAEPRARGAFRRPFLTLVLSLLIVQAVAATTRVRTAAAGPPEVRELMASSTEHFVFTFHEPDRPYIARLVALAEAERARLCADLTLPCFRGQVRVHLAATADEFSAHRPDPGAHPGLVDWAIGVAYPELRYILLRADGTALLGLDETFVHEVSHVVLRLGVGGRFLPRWFVEGVAMWQAGESVVERLRAAAPAALTGHLFPLRDLTFTFPAGGPRVNLAYAQSALFVRWLVRDVVPAGHARVAAAVAAGARFKDAFADVYGAAPDELFERWQAEFREQSSWWPILTSGTLLWLLITSLFVYAYLRKRREKQARLQAMEEAERRAETPRIWIH